jgi:hypothetical protein
LRLSEELLGGTHLRRDETFLRGGFLQIVSAPSQYGVLNRAYAVRASQELERVCLRSRIEVQGDDVAPVPCLVEDRKFEERVAGGTALAASRVAGRPVLTGEAVTTVG